MKLLLPILALLLCVALAHEYEFEGPARMIPIPRDKCPMRGRDFYFLFDEYTYNEGWISWLIESVFSEGTEMDSADYEYMYGSKGRDYLIDEINYDKINHDNPNAWSSYITRIARDNNEEYEGNMTLVICRKDLSYAQYYAEAAMSATNLGLRIVTIDVGVTREQSKASMTASEPRDKNVITYRDWFEMDNNIGAAYQLISDNIGRRCVISDRMTIHTFDGAAYTHTDIGDFVVFRQNGLYTEDGQTLPSMEVQVRKEQCKNTTRQEACISAIGLRLTEDYTGSKQYNTLTFQYDRENNDIILTFNGQIIPPETIYDTFYMMMKIRRVEPDIGIHIDLLQFFWESYDYEFDSPSFAIDFFRDETRDPLIVIQGNHFAFGRSTGMCGTFDSCAANELITINGTLVDNATVSAPTWKVHGGESAFEWQQYLHGEEEDPLAQFYLRQPFIKSGWKSDDGEGIMAEGDGVELLNEEALFTLCTDYCDYHLSGVPAIDNHPEVCDGLCDDQAVAMEGLYNFNLHTEYNDTNLPNITMGRLTDGKNVNMFAPMGGKYVFEVRAEDCCSESDPANFTITVKCSNEIGIEIETENDLYVDFGPFPLPTVRLSSKITAGDAENIHISWKILSGPFYELYEEDSLYYTLLYRNSLTPVFMPDLPGNYTFEVVAFDGCSRAFDRLNITIGCVNYTRYAAGLGGSLIYYQDNTVYIPYPKKCPMFDFYETFLTYEYGLQYAELSFNVTIPNSPDPLFEIKQAASGSSEWEVFWEAESSTSSNSTVDVQNTTDTDYDSGWGFIPNTNGIVRIEAERRTIMTVVDAKLITTQTIAEKHVIHSTQCWFYAWNSWFDGDIAAAFFANRVSAAITASELPAWANTTAVRNAASHVGPFGIGICPNWFHANVTIHDPVSCTPETNDERDIHWTCDDAWVGPYSKTIAPCFPLVFNYSTGNFDSVSLFGDDSYDRLNRMSNWQNLWSAKKWPAESDGPATFIKSNPLNWDLAVRPDVEGSYTFELAVTNGCAADTDLYTLEAVCDGDVTATIVCPASPIIYNYSDTSMNFAFLNGSLTHTTARLTSGADAPLAYSWTVTLPDGDNYTSSTVDPNVPNLVGGTYTAYFSATDRCRKDSASCSFTVQCPNTLTAASSINVTSLTYDPIYNIFGTVELTDLTSSGEAFNTIWWIYKMADNGTYVYMNSINAHNTTFTPSMLGNYEIILEAYDGCQSSSAVALYLSTACSTNVLKPYIQMLNEGGTQLYFENSTAFHAYAGASTAGTWNGETVSITMYQWIAIAPDGSIAGTGTGTDFFFYSDKIGEYNLTLTIGDGCKTVNVSMNLQLLCASTIKAKAEANAAIVAWNGKKFPVVTVFGSGTDLGEVQHSGVTSWTWYVLDAPATSVFKGEENVVYETTTEIVGLVNDTDWVINTVGWEQIYTKTLRVVEKIVTKKNTTLTRLRHLSNTDNEPFGACFRPDVPGRYKLQLVMATQCATSKDEVIVRAVCNSAPVVSASVPSTATVGEQLTFDASATTDSDGDSTFQWEVIYNENTDLSSTIVNSLSSKAVFTPHDAGNYTVILNVSDGCNEIIEEYHFNATCANITAPLESEVETKFDGIGSHIVRAQVEDVERDQTWLDSHEYTWELVSFVPPDQYKEEGLKGGQIAGIVIGVVAAAALIGVGAAFLGMFLFKRFIKAKAAGAAAGAASAATSS